MFVQGGVYLFSYLWAREHDAGEESGRKNRPACLVFRSSGGRLFLLPITTQPPQPGRASMPVPPGEMLRAGLSSASWIILDEFNSTLENQTYDFASVDPIGRFSDGFLRQLLGRLNELIRQRRSRHVQR